MHFCIIDPGPPQFWSSANIDLRPPIVESKIDAFSFRVLRTTCLTVYTDPTISALRLQKLTGLPNKHVFVIIDRGPPIFVLLPAKEFRTI